MTVGYYSNLALHISDATLKGKRRLHRPTHKLRHCLLALAGVACIWAAAGALL